MRVIFLKSWFRNAILIYFRCIYQVIFAVTQMNFTCVRLFIVCFGTAIVVLCASKLSIGASTQNFKSRETVISLPGATH